MTEQAAQAGDITPLTADEHRALAAKDIAEMRGYKPYDREYQALGISGLLHIMAAVELHWAPRPAPQVPGLPAGWTVATRPSGNSGKWGWVLTGPDGAVTQSRFSWDSDVAALGAAILRARGEIRRVRTRNRKRKD